MLVFASNEANGFRWTFAPLFVTKKICAKCNAFQHVCALFDCRFLLYRRADRDTLDFAAFLVLPKQSEALTY